MAVNKNFGSLRIKHKDMISGNDMKKTEQRLR